VSDFIENAMDFVKKATYTKNNGFLGVGDAE
jgi:hypothetical protein